MTFAEQLSMLVTVESEVASVTNPTMPPTFAAPEIYPSTFKLQIVAPLVLPKKPAQFVSIAT